MENLILLVNPRSISGIGDSTLPLGLIMTVVNLYQKFRIVIIDQRVEKDWEAHLLSLLKENPVCVGVTALTGRQIKWGLRVSKIAKDHGYRVVWGGIHASLTPSQTVQHPLIDYVVAGEGEDSFAELVNALASGVTTKNIPGVWSKEHGFGGERPLVDLNKLPPTPYHLIDLRRYIKSGPYGKTMMLCTSRGCPQRCTFCYNLSINHSRWRGFLPAKVLNEIKYILKQHPDIRHFEFWDDNFFANAYRAREIVEGIKELNVTWLVIGAHIKEVYNMDDDYLASLRNSGLKEIVMSPESGSQKIIDFIKKNYVIEELLTVNKRLGKYNIRPIYSYMSGFPGESDADVKDTLNLMFKLKKDNPNIVIGVFKPVICYPGTPLFTNALELGFKPPEKLEGWSNFYWGNYNNLKIPWVSPGRKRMLTWIYYYTLLINPDYVFIHSKLFTFVASLLCPVAKWRLRRFYFRFPVEAWVVNIISRIVAG